MKKTSDEASLFRGGKRIVLDKNDVLHSPHEVCRALGRVASGRLRFSRILSSGKEIVVKEFLPGEVFAEMIVFTSQAYPGWIIASEPSKVVEVELPDILNYLEDRENLLSFFSAMSEKITHLSNTIEIMSLKTVKQKIAFLLLSDADSIIDRETRSETRQHDQSTEEISEKLQNVSRLAEMVSCSREAVSRALTEMEALGVISRTSDGRRAVHLERLDELF